MSLEEALDENFRQIQRMLTRLNVEMRQLAAKTEQEIDEADDFKESVLFEDVAYDLVTGMVRLLEEIPRNGSHIVNTGTSHGRGAHWLGVYMTPSGVGVVYDSFGREPQRVLWRFTRAALAEHVAVSGTNPNQEQRGFSALCGQISLAFLLTVRDLGICAVAAAV
jgi:hypothetical protein